MENSIVDDLNLLYALKRELKTKRRAYNESVKGLVNSIHNLETRITNQVLAAKETVATAGIKAEYKPTVVIKMRRDEEKENE